MVATRKARGINVLLRRSADRVESRHYVCSGQPAGPTANVDDGVHAQSDWTELPLLSSAKKEIIVAAGHLHELANHLAANPGYELELPPWGRAVRRENLA